MEKNFGSALAIEGKDGGTTSTTEASGSWPSDLMSFMGQKGEDTSVESFEKLESSSPHSSSLSKKKEETIVEKSPDSVRKNEESLTPEEANSTAEKTVETDNVNRKDAVIADKPPETVVVLSEEAENVAENSEASNIAISDEATTTAVNHSEPEDDSQLSVDRDENSEFVAYVLRTDSSEVSPSKESEPDSIQDGSTTEVHTAPDSHKDEDELKTQSEDTSREVSVAEMMQPSYDY